MIWLLRRLTPDDKTIADFRKDNGPAIKKVCAQFVELCRQMGLLTKASVAIDGSKFKAVNTRDKNFTQGQGRAAPRSNWRRALRAICAQLDTADLQEPSEALAAKTAHLKEKLAKLASEMQKLDAYEKQMLASPDQQISLTDPDSRSMATSGRGSGVVGYNVQVAVDTEHHLIIAHEVTNSGSDRAQLANMATQAKEVLGVDKLEAVADRGYYSGEEIMACDDAGIAVTLPKPMTSGMEAKGQFGKQDFVYLGRRGCLSLPGRRVVEVSLHHVDGDRTITQLLDQCLSRAAISRRAAPRPRTASSPAGSTSTCWRPCRSGSTRTRRRCAQRRETVEHPFGTLKMRMGATHFLMKRLPKVATEMALARARLQSHARDEHHGRQAADRRDEAPETAPARVGSPSAQPLRMRAGRTTVASQTRNRKNMLRNGRVAPQPTDQGRPTPPPSRYRAAKTRRRSRLTVSAHRIRTRKAVGHRPLMIPTIHASFGSI